MSIDPSVFHKYNVADSCAIWNILSSSKLWSTSRFVGCTYCCTEFVHYECLVKRRSDPQEGDQEIMGRFRKCLDMKHMERHCISLEDLQDVSQLQERKRVSLGEISTMLFAQRRCLAFLTDDQKARKLACTLTPAPPVQTTPHLLAWLFFRGSIGVEEVDVIVSQHGDLGRPLGPHFRNAVSLAKTCLANAGG